MKRIDLAAGDIKRAADAIREAMGDDEDAQAYLDTLEGETDLNEYVAALLRAIEDDEGQAASLTTQMATRKERRDRCEARIEIKRRGIVRLLEAAGLDKIILPEATVSVREIAEKLSVTAPEAVPEEYTVTAPKPNLARIKAAFTGADAVPNWITRTPSYRSVTIRRR